MEVLPPSPVEPEVLPAPPVLPPPAALVVENLLSPVVPDDHRDEKSNGEREQYLQRSITAERLELGVNFAAETRSRESVKGSPPRAGTVLTTVLGQGPPSELRRYRLADGFKTFGERQRKGTTGTTRAPILPGVHQHSQPNFSVYNNLAGNTQLSNFPRHTGVVTEEWTRAHKKIRGHADDRW